MGKEVNSKNVSCFVKTLFDTAILWTIQTLANKEKAHHWLAPKVSLHIAKCQRCTA
jgi:hypothetical protein